MRLREYSEGVWRLTRVASFVLAIGLPTWSFFYMSQNKSAEIMDGELSRLIPWLSLFVVGYLIPMIFAKVTVWVLVGFRKR